MWLERRARRGERRQDGQIVEGLAYLVKDFMLHPERVIIRNDISTPLYRTYAVLSTPFFAFRVILCKKQVIFSIETRAFFC